MNSSGLQNSVPSINLSGLAARPIKKRTSSLFPTGKSNLAKASSGSMQSIFMSNYSEIANSQSKRLANNSNSQQSLKSNKQAREKLNQFRKQLAQDLTKENLRRLKKHDSAGILPHTANILRRDSQQAVEFTKRYSLLRMSNYKRTLPFLNQSIEKPLDSASMIDSIIYKMDTRKNVLDKLKLTITSQHLMPVTTNFRQQIRPEKSMDEFVQYVNWLTGVGKKQYEVQPISSKSVYNIN